MALGVYCEGKLAGKIEQAQNGTMQFRYANAWLQDPNAFALSYSLPKRDVTYLQEADSFFGNALPEGPIRQAICDKHRISIENDYALLKKIGGECAGALIISESPPETTEHQYKDLKAEDLEKRVSRDTVYASMTCEPNMRLSLAGAQDKLPIFLVEDNQLRLPLGSAPSTHILKFSNNRFKDLVPNEGYITKLAGALGLDVVDTELMQVEKDYFLVVRRFDRVPNGEASIKRLHQEDMCQALGISYRIKYENEGGPSFSKIYKLVTEASHHPLLDNQRLLRWQMVNILIGNCDGHAKNLSLLRSTDGEWALSPFYDLVCTTIYPNLSKDLAMNVGGVQNFGNLTPVHWKRLAKELGIREKLLQSLAIELYDRFPTALRETHEGMTTKYGNLSIFRRLRETLTRSHRSLKKRFPLKAI